MVEAPMVVDEQMETAMCLVGRVLNNKTNKITHGTREDEGSLVFGKGSHYANGGRRSIPISRMSYRLRFKLDHLFS